MSDFLSKEELLKKVEEDITESFEINSNGKRGSILLRGFKTTRELNQAQTEATKLNAQRLITPQLNRYSENELLAAVTMSYCIVEPKLDITEALELGDTIGPVTNVIFNRIMQLSGFSKNQMDMMEEKLRNDPFPSDDANSLLGNSKSPSRRSQHK